MVLLRFAPGAESLLRKPKNLHSYRLNQLSLGLQNQAHVCIQEVEQLDGMAHMADRHHGISLDHGSRGQLVGLW